MILFWAVAGLLSASAAGLILLRAARAAAGTQAADPSLALYRRQLDEIDELAQRGLMAEEEIRGAKAEAGRRLLSAADTTGGGWSAAAPRAPILFAAVFAAALGVALYLLVGAPGMGDQPFAKRLASWKQTDLATLTPPELAAVLRSVAKEHPRDTEVLRYLAAAEDDAGDPGAAARVLRRAVDLEPNRADLWEMLGRTLVAQQGGEEIPPQAVYAFQEAVKRDPKAMVARFFLAGAKVQSGDRAEGLAEWRALLEEIPQNDPRRQALAEAMNEAANAAPRPQAPPQMAAIEGMVAGLAARLEAQPDDPEGWVRLVRSYAVLGETAKRDAALAKARARFAARRDILQQLAEAARTEPMR